MVKSGHIEQGGPGTNTDNLLTDVSYLRHHPPPGTTVITSENVIKLELNYPYYFQIKYTSVIRKQFEVDGSPRTNVLSNS